jgi:two-component system, NtrC family, sensor kinase
MIDPSAVLVVDDDTPLHLVLERVVERAGGKAHLASSGKEALALLDERDWSAALLDKNLPDVSGIELLQRIKHKQPRTEVLIVTGYAGLESAVQALRLGAFDYVEKPFDIDDLANRLKAALARRRTLTADVAQNVEGPLLRLASELELTAGVVSIALTRLRKAESPEESNRAMFDLEQVLTSLAEASEHARQIVHSLARTP